MPDTHSTEQLKQIAVQFLQLVIAGCFDEAYRQHVAPHGKHHNPFTPAGFPALQKGMGENHGLFPHKQLTVQNVLGDGEFVAVHSHLVLAPEQNSMTVVHIFRFRDGKIVELWDCGQQIPKESPNTDGPF